jgi:hypothetical protein
MVVLLAGGAAAFATGLWVLGDEDDLLALALGAFGVATLATLDRVVRIVDRGAR